MDIHVRALEPVKRLFTALAPILGYRVAYDENDAFELEQNETSHRPRIGWIPDPSHAAGSMQIAFAVHGRDRVDAAANLARENGALAIDGPSLCPEYRDDYYAFFFEDADRNRYEVLDYYE